VVKERGFDSRESIDRSELLRIEGTVVDIVYKSDDTGYTVCVIENDDSDEPITVVGTMPILCEGDEMVALGKWVSHPNYGKQFKAEYFEKSMPTDEEAMRRYLAARSVKGIGPKLADRIVDRFREATFEVLENSPDLLCEIKGISPKKARAISDSFREQFGIRNVMMYFGGFFGAATSVRIYKKWGSAAIDVVRNDPYILCEEIYGIGFERADRLAMEMGLGKDSEQRITAGIKYLLRFNASSNGHCYLPYDKLCTACVQMLEAQPDTVKSAIDRLISSEELIVKDYDGERAVYSSEYYKAEVEIALKLISASRINLAGSVSGIDDLIRKAEEESGIKFAPMQIKSIISAIENSVTVITGGPGTGKTTIIKAILSIFSHIGMKTALAAPTGRAAKRMSETTSAPAKTIHRLLGTEFSSADEATFIKNEHDPLDADAIIVDEMSMVDVHLFSSLLKAVKPGARLVLIGDADQLPSVGPGNILNDLIESGCFAVCRLNEIFRQEKESLIVVNAHRINNGEYPYTLGKEGNFFFMESSSAERTAEAIATLIALRLPRTYGEDVAKDIQVITSTKKGPAGTKELNVKLQSALNPHSTSKKEHKYRDVIFREGDKVMQIRNDYDLSWESKENGIVTEGTGIFNGDIGIIEEIDEDELCINVRFDDKLCRYDFNLLDELEHAYAVTVHKSQGSEYPIVILPMNIISRMLATRNLLYTAVTRAKRMMIIVGRSDDLKAMVDNDRQAMRYTGLKSIIRSSRDV